MAQLNSNLDNSRKPNNWIARISAASKKSMGRKAARSAASSENDRRPVFTDAMIAEIARGRLHHESYAEIAARQAAAELKLRLVKKVNFRFRENQKAVAAYDAMDISEFEGINARQQWANWRTIPRNLSGLIENRPLYALDLCCGVGHSTEVLACYLPRGSKVLGLEYAPNLVANARKRKFYDREGQLVDVRFQAQSVLDPFLDEVGALVADASVDLVNSCGAVGFHFDTEATQTLAKEIFRVLRSGGLATIDAGLPGTSTRKLIGIFEQQGFVVERVSRSCFADPFRQVCFRKP